VAIETPVAPMLARLARELPVGPLWRYEPKWDGFRALLVRDGDTVEIWSRNARPLARYFPEIVAAVRTVVGHDAVLDGELLVLTDAGADFAGLMSRLHPAASRVERLARERPARFLLFDALSVGGHDLRARPFDRRRAELDRLVPGGRGRVAVTPTTTDPDVARAWLDETGGSGVDGVVAKDGTSPYEPGRRTMVKVKSERTMDCVVAGARAFAEGDVASLLLGLYHDDRLLHVGVASGMRAALRRQLRDDLFPLSTSLAGHPWERGYALEGGAMGRLKGAAGRWTPEMALDWVPLRPERVCEVAHEQLDGWRLRHPARFLRWRPDRDPRSCTLEQLGGVAEPPSAAT